MSFRVCLITSTRLSPSPLYLDSGLTEFRRTTIAKETLTFSKKVGLKPITTPVISPQSNGMAESFVKTMKIDYVSWMPKPDARTALQNLAIAFDHYNESHPHSALRYRSPRKFRQRANSPT